MKEPVEIEGVIVQPLKQIADNRGSVLHMLRNDSDLFNQFGEVYFSEIHPGMVKAWKRHKRQTQNLAVPFGKIRLVIYDGRPTSSTHGKITEYELGRPEHYKLVHIPPMLWYGFQEVGGQISMIANCADHPHDPKDAESKPADSDQIPYQWKI
jgi:dTDP-4-dehydrorhamnose 3,5-epimerase